MADNIIKLAELQELLTGWKSNLILTPTKTPKALLANAVTALRGAEEWRGVLAYNEFKLAIVMVKPPPWRKRKTTIGHSNLGRITKTRLRPIGFNTTISASRLPSPAPPQ
jgi:hypothetical protein